MLKWSHWRNVLNFHGVNWKVSDKLNARGTTNTNPRLGQYVMHAHSLLACRHGKYQPPKKSETWFTPKEESSPTILTKLDYTKFYDDQSIKKEVFDSLNFFCYKLFRLKRTHEVQLSYYNIILKLKSGLLVANPITEFSVIAISISWLIFSPAFKDFKNVKCVAF